MADASYKNVLGGKLKLKRGGGGGSSGAGPASAAPARGCVRTVPFIL
jgi:hypothetical protein